MQLTQTQQKETTKQEELLRILTKGMVTIPKQWRDALGIKEGGWIRARNEGGAIILDPLTKEAPYRIYTQEEIDEFLRDDALPPSVSKK